MSTMSRVNRPGPRRRCPPCPACGEDAMRQYGAKHHGVVSRYFYACQHCQHTDVWREIHDGPRYFERLRVPLVPPKPEQCRLELDKNGIGHVPRPTPRALISHATVFSLSSKGSCISNHESDTSPCPALGKSPAPENVPRRCTTCARYLESESQCRLSEDMRAAIHAALGIVITAIALPVDANAITDCSDWLDPASTDTRRVLSRRQISTSSTPHSS